MGKTTGSRAKKRAIRDPNRPKRRTIGIAIVICLCLAGLLARVGYIKIAYGNEYERDAVIQAYNGGNNVEEVVTPNRGSILDRNMQPLAVSETVYNVILDIRNLVTLDEKQISKTVTTLSTVLSMQEADIRALLAKDADGKLVNDTMYYQLAKQVSADVAKQITDAAPQCVYLVNDTKRDYVYGTFAPQVIGFQRGDPGEDRNWGLENSYNNDLTGTPGRIFRTFTQDNNAVTEDVPATQGYSLVTTLDMDIQNICQDAASGLGEQFDPQYASVVVMNPNTCEILGMAQYPSFSDEAPSDPTYFTSADMKQTWDTLSPDLQSTDLYNTWVNYNITRTFEPGSIFKPITVAAALEEGLISANSTFYCPGFKQVADWKIPCWIYAQTGGGHGEETVTQVLANSCNVGLMDIVQILGRDLFFKYRTDFGFGELTGIDLPGEADVSSPKVLYPLSALNPVELATSSFGQGFNCTAIQAMTAFAALINGGNLMKPYVVSQVIDADGNVVRTNSPEVVRKVISQQTSDTIRHMLNAVIQPSPATGWRAMIDGYEMGGKTGTAQEGDRSLGQWLCSFISFIPVENPQYLVLVLIDRPAGDSETQSTTSAGPMMKQVMQNLIKLENIPPDSSGSSQSSVADSLDEVVIPDYTGEDLVSTTKSLNNLGMDYSISGNGDTVTGQFPVGGQSAPPGSKILIYISNSSADTSGLVTVPNVVGQTADAAVVQIQDAGFVPVPSYPDINGSTAGTAPVGDPITTNVSPDDQVSQSAGADSNGDANQSGTVYDQMPAAGAAVQSGTEVKLKIRFD